MKSTVNEKPGEKKCKYPCLMISNSKAIYLLTDKNKGICLASGGGYAVGEIGEQFSTLALDHFHGSVCLEND